MTQEDIIEILGDRPLSRREIQNLVGLTQQAISEALRQLIKYDEIIKEYSNKGIPVYKKKRKSGAKRPKNK